MRVALVVALLVVAAAAGFAQSPVVPASPAPAPSSTPAETIPGVPARYFNDYTLTTSPRFADDLNGSLERFEHATTNQFLVVLYPRMQTAASMDDYCLRIFNAWHVGQKGVNNGVVLFVFVEDRKLRIEVGRGLERVLTNAVCQEIVRTIAAKFRTGDYEGGITAGADAVIKTLQAQPPQPAAP